jgi:hypothetical protein
VISRGEIEQLETAVHSRVTSLGATNPFTIRRILVRNAASSTPRVRFPCDGRTLIIESYSIQSASSADG